MEALFQSSSGAALLAIDAALFAAGGAGLLGWLLARRASRVEAAAEHAAQQAAHQQVIVQAEARVQAKADVQIATLSERLRGIELELADEADSHHHFRSRSEAFREQLDQVSNERAQLAERAARVPALSAELEVARTDVARLASQRAELTTRLDAERSQSQEKLALLADAKQSLSDQFKTLAGEILEEKSRRFAEQNQSSLGQLLDPLKNRLSEFQGKVEQLYDTEGKERSALAGQVTHLMQLNRTLSDDAKNLTQALKGSAKAQGNWGELMLERVLEAAGLRKGSEYEVQTSHTRADGSRAQPDVVIRLPEGRRLVVDAKVSLLAYEEMATADDPAIRSAAGRRHLDSVRKHIGGLSARNYELIYGIQSLDFVLLFVPIEPAFNAAMQADAELFMHAWDRNVLLVSPSTLLFVVRTVAHLWRQDQQSRNTQEIARRGAELYDKFAAFVSDLEKVGRSLESAQVAYADAFNKLSRNKGNLVRQAEMLKGLGLKPTKALPVALVESAADVGVESGANDDDDSRAASATRAEGDAAPAAAADSAQIP